MDVPRKDCEKFKFSPILNASIPTFHANLVNALPVVTYFIDERRSFHSKTAESAEAIKVNEKKIGRMKKFEVEGNFGAIKSHS